ncbi:hypothetical protein [Insolitispirillum peregrinum]|uniref:hypothetical protein n=1 Tax=Insolitispirillum peregrinum TaxID=80876 RepID=UPI0036088A71
MSDKIFGAVWLFILCGITLFPLASGVPPRWPLLFPVAILAAIVLLRPSLLGPLNRLWQAFGTVMHTCVSTLALLVLYFLIFTPGAWFVRLCGHNPVTRTFDPAADSYWTHHQPPQPTDFTRPY